MLKSLKIDGFQSLKNVSLDFDDGVNTIIGETDSGKSAIFRALKTLCLNTDKDYLNYQSEEYNIEAVFEDHTVKLEKPKNSYTLDLEVFNSVGRNNVPDKISDLINMRELEFDNFKTSVNFSNQRDDSFLVEPGQKIANIIGKISGIDHILLAIKLVNLDKRRNNDFLKTELKIKEEKEFKLDLYKGIDEKSIEVGKLINIYDKLDNSYEKLELIKKLSNSYKTLKNDLKLVNKNIEKCSKLLKFNSEIDKLNQFKNKLVLIREHIDSIKIKDKEIKILNNKLESYKHIDDISQSIKKLNDDINKFSNIKKQYEKYKILISAEEKVNESLKNVKFDIDDLKKKHMEFISTLKICPIIKDVYKNGCLEKLRGSI